MTERLNINTEEEFNQLMESVDAEMCADNVPIVGRELEGMGLICARFGLRFTYPLPDREPEAGNYWGDIALHAARWFKARYGERLNMTTNWSIALLLRGDVYRIRMPVFVSGTVLVECSPEQFGRAKPGMGGINPLDMIDGMTETYAKVLNRGELAGIFSVFMLGFKAQNEIEPLSSVRMISEAIGDLHASTTHLLAMPRQYGLSKWASLQAVEKLIKSFIAEQGQNFPHNHDLTQVATRAESLGLRPIPRELIGKVQCWPEIRYGETPVSLIETMAAYYAAFDICIGIARQIPVQSVLQAMNAAGKKASTKKSAQKQA